MVVDDAAFMRLRASKVLQENGHDVVQAENGLEAVKQYAEHHPDAVLMDITMPEMDGLEALAAIREQDPSARVAMLTAMGQQSIVMDAIKRGARDFVVKPFAPDRVLHAVAKLLGQAPEQAIEEDFALLLEPGAEATTRHAISRRSRRARELAAARTYPVDSADHHLARAHVGSPPRSTVRLLATPSKLIEPMDSIECADNWASTGVGNQGTIACHSGAAATRSTTPTCDDWI